MNFYLSESLQLAPLAESDASDFYPLIERNRKQLAKFLYWVDGIRDVDSTREYLTDRANSAAPGAQWFKIICHHEVCGVFGIKSIVEQTAEVGYWLDQQQQGKGIMTQILKKISGYLLHRCQVTTMEFRCLSENSASIGLAKRFKANLVDERQNYQDINNKAQSLLIYHAKLSVAN